MKIFKVTKHGVFEGVGFVTDPYPHIPIGEEGRGRRLVRFPLAARFAESLESTRIERASIIKTRQKGTLLMVEEKDPADRRALVHLAVEAGFRGGAEWTGPKQTDVPCPYQGDPNCLSVRWEKDGGQYCRECGTRLIYENFMHFHPKEGTVVDFPELDYVPGVTVLAMGWRAQGDAGRMGGHPEYLVILQPGTLLRVRRTGRLYGAPPVKYLHWDGETLQFGTYDEVFPPSYEPEEGELV
ncbi:hypothetical protein [Caldibacillus debilis]|uniref:Uncharacterized protein n=1 Tax=Caldibacillus debilis GB1 TaxID=1339248 RepID=A0A420VEI2_9BACI|nr:hypothetical protein [Caldibacillus debilis]RKO61818.1 hypothetical protein Cdeb_01313 [Caldibacillus debilis GB1]